MSLQNLNEKERELINLNEKLNENKLKLQNDYVNIQKKIFFLITLFPKERNQLKESQTTAKPGRAARCCANRKARPLVERISRRYRGICAGDRETRNRCKKCGR